MINPLIFMIVFVGIFTQSLTGFGFALVAMPLLLQLLGAKEAASLGALLAITNQIFLIFRFRGEFNLRAVMPLCIASLIGIPIGISLLSHVDSTLLLMTLGVVLVVYSAYALLNLRVPYVEHTGWALGFGFVAGLLSGAYNTGGPPLVIYGTWRGWSPAQFKSNLQGIFLLTSLTNVMTHALSRHYTPDLMQTYILSLPFVALGLWLGGRMDKHINPSLFRRLVLVLLFVIGLTLIF